MVNMDEESHCQCFGFIVGVVCIHIQNKILFHVRKCTMGVRGCQTLPTLLIVSTIHHDQL